MRTTNLRNDGARAGPAMPRAGESALSGRAASRACSAWSAAVCAAVTLILLATGQLAAEEGVTLGALQIAYGRECNAGLHYGAFASRAEREGMAVAALAFRAVAIGESVHAAHHAARIEELGAVPSWTIESVVVRPTRENLRLSIESENRESQTVYRRLVDPSRPECLYEALASMNYARAAEATHAILFAEVLQTFESIEPPAAEPASATYTSFVSQTAWVCYVCMGDGSVFGHEITGACPNCGSGRDSFCHLAVQRAPGWSGGFVSSIGGR